MADREQVLRELIHEGATDKLMKPADALGQAIARGCSAAYTHSRAVRRQPGAIVNRMRGSAREALTRLTSQDLAGIRVEPWEVQGEAWEHEQRIRKLLRDFDAQTRKFEPGFSHT